MQQLMRRKGLELQHCVHAFTCTVGWKHPVFCGFSDKLASGSLLSVCESVTTIKKCDCSDRVLWTGP